MTTFTKAELVKRTLQNLRQLGAGASPTAEDAEIVGEKIDNIHAGLAREGLTNDGAGVWTVETVPDFAAEPYIAMASAACGDTFHIPENRMVRLLLKEVETQAQMRRRVATLNDHQPVKAEQF